MANEKKKKGRLGKLVLFVLILLVVAVFVLFYFADNLIKLGVETASTKALGTSTHLDKASLSFLEGSLALQGLQVENIDGYQNPYLLEMGRCDTKVNIASLTKDTIQIHHIILNDLSLTLEQKGLGSNLQDMLDHINSGATKPQTPQPAKEGQKSSEKKLLVQRIEINNARANVKLLSIPGRENTFTIKLAPIVMENVSDESNKAEMSVDVIRKILLALAQAVLDSAADLPANLINGLEDSVQQLKEILPNASGLVLKQGQAILQQGTKAIDATGQKMKETLKSTEEAVKQGGKTLEEAGKNLGDLFKTTEKKEEAP